jgi:hypothetical protein
LDCFGNPFGAHAARNAITKTPAKRPKKFETVFAVPVMQ